MRKRKSTRAASGSRTISLSTPANDPLAGFSRAQRAIIEDDAAIQQVAAAAGSGKTRTVAGLVSHRVRMNQVRPEEVLLLSFSRKAAGELRERFAPDLAERLEISTFHSFCFRRLREFHPLCGPGLKILEDDEKRDFLRGYLRRRADEIIGGIPYEMLLDQPQAFRARFPELARAAWSAFAEYKQRRGALEYEDLIHFMLTALREGGPPARRLRKRYGFVLVDEFQDTDPRQLEFLQLMQPPRLTVVGDDYQAIYSFRGATVQPFLDFPRFFPGARTYRLEENYRSLDPVIRVGRRIIQASSRQLKKRVRSVRGAGPRLPALAVETERGSEAELLAALPEKAEYQILVRTNYRRRRWLEAGAPPERVLTIHRAKGLEFPVVFLDLISGWSSGKTRLAQASEDSCAGDRDTGGNVRNSEQVLRQAEREQRDEEIRVLYVGASRAENLLVTLHRAEYSDRDREGEYWRELIGPLSRPCRPEDLGEWLEREARFRKGN